LPDLRFVEKQSILSPEVDAILICAVRSLIGMEKQTTLAIF